MVRNAHIRFGDTTIMVSEAVPRMEASPATFYLYVEDADAATERAVGAGGKQRGAVADMPIATGKAG